MLFKTSILTIHAFLAACPFVTSSLILEPRIIGGSSVTSYDAYPYIAAFGGNAGGTLIAPRVILTAAHCEVNKGNVITVGGIKLYDPDGVATFRNGCQQWISHPNYNENTEDYDIALCILDQDVTLRSSNVELELNFDDTEPVAGDTLSVIGFGIQNNTDPYNPTRDGQLHQVDVPYVTKEVCKPIYSARDVTDRMLCAGNPIDGGKDACVGDSGGPLIKKIGNRHVHVGVSSWGGKCAAPGIAGVYSRISTVESWIKAQVCDGGFDASFCPSESPSESPSMSPPESPSESPSESPPIELPVERFDTSEGKCNRAFQGTPFGTLIISLLIIMLCAF